MTRGGGVEFSGMAWVTLKTVDPASRLNQLGMSVKNGFDPNMGGFLCFLFGPTRGCPHSS